MNKKVMFKWIRAGGMLALIPIVLAAGPFAGYMAADLLIKRFNFPDYTTAICVIIGFAAGFRETIRIIKAASRAGDK